MFKEMFLEWVREAVISRQRKHVPFADWCALREKNLRQTYGPFSDPHLSTMCWRQIRVRYYCRWQERAQCISLIDICLAMRVNKRSGFSVSRFFQQVSMTDFYNTIRLLESGFPERYKSLCRRDLIQTWILKIEDQWQLVNKQNDMAHNSFFPNLLETEKKEKEYNLLKVIDALH